MCLLCANHTCETAADGACWNSVMLIDGKEETVKSCLSPSEMKGQVFCYSSRNVSKRNCCFTDFCNNETLHIYPGVCLGIKEKVFTELECSSAKQFSVLFCQQKHQSNLRGISHSFWSRLDEADADPPRSCDITNLAEVMEGPSPDL